MKPTRMPRSRDKVEYGNIVMKKVHDRNMMSTKLITLLAPHTRSDSRQR
jgi:hypothetical protein